MPSPIAALNSNFTINAREGDSLRWRFVLFVLLAGYYLLFALFPQFFGFIGVTHFWGWFLDSHAIVAASDAAVAGLDVHSYNPLDMLGRPHVYPRLWLVLSDLGISREHNFLLGGVFVAGFFVASMWWLGPRSLGEALWYFAVMSSGAIALGVERANNDLFVFFVLMSVIPMMASERAWVRNLAIAPIVLATALKLYPAVAILILVARGGTREVVGRVGFACVLLASFFFLERHDLMSMSGVVPAPRGIISFGAEQLLAGFGLGKFVRAGLVFAVVFGSVLLCRPWRWFGDWKVSEAHPREWIGFVLGATLLTGCYFSGSSYVYRLVFCIMMAPFLWLVIRDPHAPKAVGRLAWATAGFMFFMLWADMMVLGVGLSFLSSDSSKKMVEAYVLGRGPLMPGFFICLLCFLTHFVRDAIRAVLFGREEASDSDVIHKVGV